MAKRIEKTEESKEYIRQPSLKEIVVSESKYDCELIDSVVMFNYLPDDKEVPEIKKWLKTYGDPIPFSYGFKKK